MTPLQSRKWWQVQKTDGVGWISIAIAVTLLVVWIMTDKVHGWEKWVLGFSMVFFIFGALMLTPDTAGRAVSKIAGVFKLWKGKNGTEEHKSNGG